MNQINLDKLQQLSPAQRSEAKVLNLLAGQVYQAQVEQLSAYSFNVKVNTAQGLLQIALPSTVPPALRGAVQAQFKPLANGEFMLTLSGMSRSTTLVLDKQQLTALFSSVLLFDNQQSKTSANSQPPTLNSRDIGQPALVQRLVQLFNQQGHSLNPDTHQPVLASSSAASATLNPVQQVLGHILAAAKLPPLQPSVVQAVQLQYDTTQPRLLLLQPDLHFSTKLTADALSKPIHFFSYSTSPVTPQAVVADKDMMIQQAWRNLLPLMAQQADTLENLAELPLPVQRILQLVRASQSGGQNVASGQQIMAQLNSLLQFQPMQANASVQTSGGALAVAIQLLLGHLLQKPQAAAANPANKALLQLINQLEPGQAGKLLSQLSGHSSKIQQAQLATLDGPPQQQFVLHLPLQQGSQSVFSQILLEQREADGKDDNNKTLLWQLTLKFDLPQLGQLMVIARLHQQQLQLHFYTEQQQAQRLTEQFLPLLKDRCRAQGLDVTKAECTLGKIPESLLPRANSLLAIKV